MNLKSSFLRIGAAATLLAGISAPAFAATARGTIGVGAVVMCQAATGGSARLPAALTCPAAISVETHQRTSSGSNAESVRSGRNAGSERTGQAGVTYVTVTY